MLRCSRRILPLLAAAGLLAAAPATVPAAELGDARVSSHIGQPLVADIELAMIDDPAQTVSVRVASAEVYQGAGIAMPPVLAGLNLSVMRRDGRQFLHVTSLRPVDSEHLHLYLELSDKGQRTVRLATLWLTPDPNPAPPPVAAPVPVPVPAPVVRREPMAAAAPAAPSAPAPRTAARKAEPASATIAQAAPKPTSTPTLKPMLKPAPLPVHASEAAAPAVCAQQTEQARICAALDGKNAALKAQLGSLEGKVKSLQATLGAATARAPAAVPAAAPAPAPAAAATHEPPGPKPISAIKPLVPRKPKTPAPEPAAGLPWGWIGGGAALLLALGGALLLLRRRVRTVRNVDIPAGPRLVDRLRHSFPARPKPAAEEPREAVRESAEPSFD